jgi:hypothetical protein
MLSRLVFLLHILYQVYVTNAAFSLRTSFDGGYVQQNAGGTWCYYPLAGLTRAVSCGGDYTFVLGVHINNTISIGYYQPDGTRSGGPEWPVPAERPGLVYLCASGRAGDGTYQTWCGPESADNVIGASFGRVGGCIVAIAQKAVTDGCYVPGERPYPTDSPTLTGSASSGATQRSFSSSRPIGTLCTCSSMTGADYKPWQREHPLSSLLLLSSSP